jgi:hypothetical protein
MNVVDLNNQGVTLLQEGGSYKEANALFRQALGTYVASIRQANKVVSCCSSSLSPPSNDVTADDNMPREISTATTGDDNIMALERSFSPENSFVFYSKPFLIQQKNNNINLTTTTTPTTTTTTTKTCKMDRIDITVALLYNLGLTSHYMAIRTGQSNYVKRSMFMYRKALLILGNDTVFDDSSMNILLLATCNNLGHCSSYLFDDHTTRQCQNHITSILAHLEHNQKKKQSSSSSPPSAAPTSAWENEYNCFYSSTVLHVYSSCNHPNAPVVPLAPAA